MDHKIPKLSEERSNQLQEVETSAIANFQGQVPDLISALGMLRVGDYFGWRVLVIMHNKKTIRKYENVLGIEVRSFFPEEGPGAERSRGYRVARSLSNFWKAVSGDTKVEDRHLIDKGT